MPSRASTLLLCAFCALLPATLVLSTAILPITLAVAAVLGLVAAWRDGLVPALPRDATPWLGLLLVAWAVSASFWSPRTEEALLLVLRLGAIGLAGGILIALALRLQPAERALVARWLCIGFACGLAIFVFERLTDSVLHRLVEEPRGGRTALVMLNRGATGLALLVWPVTALLLRGPAGRLALLLPALLIGLLLFYESHAAILAAAVGLAALLLGLVAPRGALAVALGMLLVGVLGAPLIAGQIPASETYQPNGVSYSGQHRLYVWHFVAERIADKPFFGWGFDGSRAIPDMGIVPFDRADHLMPTHPHNGPLQVWLELGLVGAAIVLALLVSLWRLIGGLGATDRAAGLALLAAAFVVASLSYDIWQSKWVASLVAFALVVVASRGAAAEPAAPGLERARPPAAEPAPGDARDQPGAP